MPPRRLIGGFTSESSTDVLYENNPEILSEYIHVSPITIAGGESRATRSAPLPTIAGVVAATSNYPDEVFALFDLMMSEKAFLIGRFGEPGVDWKEASVTDIDLYGRSAAIHVLNHLGGRVQNKQLCEIGPYYAYPQYADSVTWSGFEADQQYLNARAHQACSEHLPDVVLPPLMPQGELSVIHKQIDVYTENSIKAFTTGELDPFNDEDWYAHMETYKVLGIDKLSIFAGEQWEGKR